MSTNRKERSTICRKSSTITRIQAELTALKKAKRGQSDFFDKCFRAAVSQIYFADYYPSRVRTRAEKFWIYLRQKSRRNNENFPLCAPFPIHGVFHFAYFLQFRAIYNLHLQSFLILLYVTSYHLMIMIFQIDKMLKSERANLDP